MHNIFGVDFLGRDYPALFLLFLKNVELERMETHLWSDGISHSHVIWRHTGIDHTVPIAERNSKSSVLFFLIASQ